jgi:methylenetetrahydrofolate--tRNA-(uracil-5-)-methyltransferase
MLPGLGEAVFARFGSIHRNTYVNAPIQLAPDLELKARPGVFLAGQMAGVEGYVESAALGLLAGTIVAQRALGQPLALPPAETAHGALLRHLQNADAKHFQPMNVNYGLFPPLGKEEATFVAGSGRRKKLPKREKNQKLAARALVALETFEEWGTLPPRPSPPAPTAESETVTAAGGG